MEKKSVKGERGRDRIKPFLGSIETSWKIGGGGRQKRYTSAGIVEQRKHISLLAQE